MNYLKVVLEAEEYSNEDAEKLVLLLCGYKFGIIAVDEELLFSRCPFAEPSLGSMSTFMHSSLSCFISLIDLVKKIH